MSNIERIKDFNKNSTIFTNGGEKLQIVTILYDKKHNVSCAYTTVLTNNCIINNVKII